MAGPNRKVISNAFKYSREKPILDWLLPRGSKLRSIIPDDTDIVRVFADVPLGESFCTKVYILFVEDYRPFILPPNHEFLATVVCEQVRLHAYIVPRDFISGNEKES